MVEIAIQHEAEPSAVLVYRDHTSEYHYNAVQREPFRALIEVLVGDSTAPSRSVSKPTVAYWPYLRRQRAFCNVFAQQAGHAVVWYPAPSFCAHAQVREGRVWCGLQCSCTHSTESHTRMRVIFVQPRGTVCLSTRWRDVL